ncbi:hypothetical protein VPH35_084069 [Triticum aestivum]
MVAAAARVFLPAASCGTMPPHPPLVAAVGCGSGPVPGRCRGAEEDDRGGKEQRRTSLGRCSEPPHPPLAAAVGCGSGPVPGRCRGAEEDDSEGKEQRRTSLGKVQRARRSRRRPRHVPDAARQPSLSSSI